MVVRSICTSVYKAYIWLYSLKNGMDTYQLEDYPKIWETGGQEAVSSSLATRTMLRLQV